MGGSPARPGAWRTALNALYDGAGVLAALCLVGLLVMVMLSILGRQLHFNLPGVDAYAGYAMAAAGFLALAQTLKRGEHIRVTLLVTSLRGGWKRGFELWALSAATLLSLLFAAYSVRLAWQSYTLHDISTASDATPLWIPQIPMAVGAIVLAIALIDELVLEALGRRAVHTPEEATRNE